MINHEMLIYRCVSPNDKILNGKDAVYDTDLDEVYSSNRYLATRELNKHGFRILQFLHGDNNIIYGEWVLVEKIQ